MLVANEKDDQLICFIYVKALCMIPHKLIMSMNALICPSILPIMCMAWMTLVCHPVLDDKHYNDLKILQCYLSS